ncbi:glycosyltransferase family 2 protein [Microbulbifer sp. ALW1]|uniref:glycosyltransferase family 2 protein n=1 Tax=Microbulbifer sp. (strain ALW1) TaxID=1516059 RepID=UPI00135C10F9|nr:glycosyltransferase family 2 protein [Microbulbifer sp. ALW1]
MPLNNVTEVNVCRILVGVITYNPNKETLYSLISNLAAQPYDILIFDNASNSQAELSNIFSQWDNVIFLRSEANIGLASAANRIFETGTAGKYDFVALFDQDSLPEKNYLSVLRSQYYELKRHGKPDIAAISGTQLCNFSGTRAPFIRYSAFFPTKVYPSQFEGSGKFDFLITSGCLFPLSIIDAVGPFDEDLFIDNVDVEWCCRARSLGYELVGTNETSFSHSIGDDVYKLFGKIVARRHSPIRSYYSVRNLLALSKRRYVSAAWKINAIVRALAKSALIILLSKERVKYSREIFRALKDVKNISTSPNYRKHD